MRLQEELRIAKSGPLILLVTLQLIFLVFYLSQNPSKDLNLALDDGYIYGNYVVNAASGHWFEYNLGEKSGGITSFLWFVLAVPVYRALNLVCETLPALHFTFYLLAALCMTGTAGLTFLVAKRVFASDLVALLAGIAVVADSRLLWAGLSGMETPLTTVVVVGSLWGALATMGPGPPNGRARQRGFLVLSVLCVLAYSSRPEMVLWVGGILAGMALVARQAGKGNGALGARRILGMFGLCAVGVGIVMGIYLWQTRHVFPSSAYAKAGRVPILDGIPLFLGQLTAYEWVGWAAVAVSALIQLARGGPREKWLIAVLPSALFFLAKVKILPWLGQEHRYMVSLTPVAVVFGLGWVFLGLRKALDSQWLRGGPGLRRAYRVGVVVLAVAIGSERAFAGVERYKTFVYDRMESDVAVGIWLREHTPKVTVVAVEMAGSIHTYSQRRTIDVVGLTSPECLGLYPDWTALFPVLRRSGVKYVVYYPAWFVRDGQDAMPPGLTLCKVFSVKHDGDVPIGIGAKDIAIYQTNW